jgi:transposase
MKKKNDPEKIELNQNKVDDLENEILSGNISKNTQDLLIKIINWAVWVNNVLELKSLSMKRFKRMIFGSKTEKVKKEKPDKKDNDKGDGSSSGNGNNPPPKKKTKKTGNGKTTATNYNSSNTEFHAHETLSPGDTCPACGKSKLYKYAPSVLVTFNGNQPITTTKHEVQRLRCNGCGELFTPEISKKLKEGRYDKSVATTLALMRYGMGMASYRLEGFQRMMGVPMPDSTQWDLMEKAASPLYPIFLEFQKFGANAGLLYHDDTPAKILDHMQENKDKNDKERCGSFTTAMLAVKDKIKVALYFSGRNHAGENVLGLLNQRDLNLEKIITMSDASPSAMPKGLNAHIANCMSHARRKFYELLEAKKATNESTHMLKWFGLIYHNDKITKELELSDEDRLKYHGRHSAKIVKRIFKWCHRMIREKKVEPNSTLGGAILYMLNHWSELTKFMTVAGVPLDNNICERLVKSSILYRKNSLFYKSEYGALIGDIYMSIIQTCKNMKINPFKYLQDLQINKKEVIKYPEKWMPWNFEQNVLA